MIEEVESDDNKKVYIATEEGISLLEENIKAIRVDLDLLVLKSIKIH